MLGSKSTQFTLSPEGKILWQEKINNPLPGIEVAFLVKGDHPLKPAIAITQNDVTAKYDAQQVMNDLNLWLNTHLMAVLEPLMLLGIKTTDSSADAADDNVEQIVSRVFDGLGIVPRESVEDLILKLTPEKRAVLRAKKIRLGPILVFIPALNKPAAVRLRGLLWSLFNDKELPAKVPNDGIVSQKIEADSANEDFYRAVGYPIYGGRAVRIDMLDRVISSVYDNSKEGEFEARHEMAEWLGTPIEDLYKILESMGHKKISDPHENIQTSTDQPAETLIQAAPVEPVVNEISETAIPSEKKAENIKPPLARFRLKKGKAFEKSKPRNPAFSKENQDSKKKEFTKPDKAKGQSSYKKENDKPNHKKPYDKKHDKNKKEYEPRIISLEAKKREEDSPFAVLQQLKVKNDV